jgi:hypothetical protein
VTTLSAARARAAAGPAAIFRGTPGSHTRSAADLLQGKQTRRYSQLQSVDTGFSGFVSSDDSDDESTESTESDALPTAAAKARATAAAQPAASGPKKKKKKAKAKATATATANCPHCERANTENNNTAYQVTFASASSLKVHIETVHQKVRSYWCPHCSSHFGHQSNMKQHVRAVHEKRRDHACARCAAAFGTASGLARHVRNATCTRSAHKHTK